MIGRFLHTAVTNPRGSAPPQAGTRVANVFRAAAILLAVIATMALGVGLYLWRPAALFALLPYALFALCPVSMWLMMRSMNSSNDTKGQSS